MVPQLVLVFTTLILLSCLPKPASDSNQKGAEANVSADEITDLSLNDVAILYPLPKSAELNKLPGITIGDDPTDTMPASVAAKIPKLIQTSEPPISLSVNDLREELKVVAVRIDPCFAVNPGESDCNPQIRLVVQPIQTFGAGVSARDTTLHLAYAMTSAEIQELLRGLVSTRGPRNGDAKNETLTVNPTLVSQGLDGSYASAIKNQLEKFAVSQRLVGVTFSALRDRGNQWVFGGYIGAPGNLGPVRVAGTNPTANQIAFTMGSRPQFGRLEPCCGSIFPEPIGTDTTAAIVKVFNVPTAQTPNLKEALASIDRIENPSLNSPLMLDCTACHTAAAARQIAEAWDSKFSYQPQDRYKSEWTLENSTQSNIALTNLRAFGYKGTLPSINQRTINESAESLKQLHELGKGNE